ncbi:MAG TPA: hypothetical protein PKL97_03805 [Candidatus Omnitrophota bacterium]|nr:hypothetical protein [Candidatus Omnitrophota bacterium]
MTLVEVLLSFAILVPVLLISLFALTYAQQACLDCGMTLQAMNVARSALEVVKNTPLTQVPLIDMSAQVPDSLPNGAIVISTNPAVINGTSQFAVVTITVSWRETKGRPKSLQVTTIRSRF